MFLNGIARRFSKFLTAGVVTVAVDYGVFVLLSSSGIVGVVLANTISFTGAFFVNFSLNRNWVFKSQGRGKAQLFRYSMLAFVNLIISNIAIHFLVNIAGMNAQLSKLFIVAAIALWNYFVFSRFIFGNKQ